MTKILGGSAFGQGDALVDTSGAVLLDRTDVAIVGALRQDGAETLIALELAGRINHSTDRSDVLYLMNADGAAGIVSELLGLAERADPNFLALLLDRIRQLPTKGQR